MGNVCFLLCLASKFLLTIHFPVCHASDFSLDHVEGSTFVSIPIEYCSMQPLNHGDLISNFKYHVYSDFPFLIVFYSYCLWCVPLLPDFCGLIHHGLKVGETE